MKKILHAVLALLLGKIRYQWFFEKAYFFALKGRNIGTGGMAMDVNGEAAALRFIRKKLSDRKEPMIIFDIGAQHGNYTHEILKAFEHKEKQIFLFEPSHEAFTTLKNRFGSSPSLHLYPHAVGSKSGSTRLFSPRDISGLSSMYGHRFDDLPATSLTTEEVPMVTISEFCAQESIKRIHLLKMDVEGNELECLKGAGTLLDDSIDFIQFEFGVCNIFSKTYFRDFYDLLHEQYYIFRILKDGPYLIDRYRPSDELFVTTNFLAERKKKS